MVIYAAGATKLPNTHLGKFGWNTRGESKLSCQTCTSIDFYLTTQEALHKAAPLSFANRVEEVSALKF